MTEDSPDYTLAIVATTIVESIPVTVEPARAYWEGKTRRYEDTSFISAESGRVLAAYADLGRNAHDGYFTNDGAGDIVIEIEDPDAGWGDKHTLKKDDTLDLFMANIKNIRLTWVADCGYRCMVL